MARGWTKKDVKVMQQAISTFWLYNRPLGDSVREHDAALAEVRDYLRDHRAEVVLHGITELGNIARERYVKNAETAEHFETHPEVYGKSTPEMVERFRRLAEEDRRDFQKAKDLMDRIQTEELPPEVTSFDPLQRA